MAENESKTEEKIKGHHLTIIGFLIVVFVVGVGLYWYVSSQTIYIDQSVIQAPIINLSPSNSGTLQAVFVNVGDKVIPNQPIARVGDEIVESKTSGEIVSVNQNVGEFLNALTGQAIVATMIDPTQLRVVGHLDENKGLAEVNVGDVARFTVDTFGAKEYYGVVDEIGQTSQLSVTSNIFNQRPVNEFNVYVRFDPARYPELKDGMSARIWVYLKYQSLEQNDLKFIESVSDLSGTFLSNQINRLSKIRIAEFGRMIGQKINSFKNKPALASK
jgi:multidrug resistance efflux pump